MTAANATEWTSRPAGRIALWSGPVSIGVSAVGILAATLLAPWFSWTGNALSDLGAAGADTGQLFNGTLILTGVLGVPFAARLYAGLDGSLRRLGVAVFGVSMVFLALVGVFALPSPSHAPVAMAFFLLFTVGIGVDGAGSIRQGRRSDGALSVGLAAVHVLAWIAWGASGHEGIALPEIAGSAVIWIWVFRRFVALRS